MGLYCLALSRVYGAAKPEDVAFCKMGWGVTRYLGRHKPRLLKVRR